MAVAGALLQGGRIDPAAAAAAPVAVQTKLALIFVYKLLYGMQVHVVHVVLTHLEQALVGKVRLLLMLLKELVIEAKVVGDRGARRGVDRERRAVAFGA